MEAFPDAEAEWVVQAEQRGTGHAVLMGGPTLEDFEGTLLVVCGDTPLLQASTLDALLRGHAESGADVTVLSMRLPDPSGYGRIVRAKGDEIAAIAADTEEHALDAVRAIKIEYEVLPHLVLEEDALKNDQKTAPPQAGNRDNLRPGGEGATGNVEEAFKSADAVVEGEYGVAAICHQCLESHGLVAEWGADGGLTVWCSTQATYGTAQGLARPFNIQTNQVRCITHHMGGGYGSKFGPDVQGIAAAELARKTKAAVKLMLDREEEIIAGGNRPSAIGTVKLAGMKDGTITAYKVDCFGTPGYTGGATVNQGLLPYVYTEIANIHRNHMVVRTNTGRNRAIEEAAGARLRTETGERLAEDRRALMREFAARLRAEHAQFSPASRS